jgi:DNA-binding NtrC family response regulator
MTTRATVATRSVVASKGGKVTVRTGPAQGAVVEVGLEPVLVGRNAGCQLVLPDPHVSSVHIELAATERGVRVRDLGSRNGTFMNGGRVVEIILSERTLLSLGETELSFEPTAPTEVALGTEDCLGPMRGSSAAMRAIFARLGKVAATDLTVLLLGETGTGKEVAAQAIHQVSRRAQRPLVVIDCGSIVHTLAESTLFGHERGAFTGADAPRISPFVEADGGTVFLDEIGELPLETQPKLLRALAERRVKPVGARGYVPFDVRVVAATRRDLTRSVNEGSFRSDLYFRLAQFTVTLPPLRERLDDLAGLVRGFLEELGQGAAFARIPRASLERLARYDWPGNVRELRNAVAVALALSDDKGVLDVAAQLGSASRAGRSLPGAHAHFRASRRRTIERFEQEYFEQLLQHCAGNISEIARLSGLERAHVRRYLKRYGLKTEA